MNLIPKLAAPIVLLLAGCTRGNVQHSPPAVWSGPLPVLALAYQRTEGIYVRDSAGGERLVAAGGTCPRFSPDGSLVAFVGENAIFVVPAAGGAVRTLAGVGRPRALCWHPAGDSVYFTDGESVRKVTVAGGEVTTVLQGPRVMELDVAHDGSLMLATVKEFGGYRLEVYELPSGRSRKLASGCSASLSPDGSRATANQGSHRFLTILDAVSGAVVERLDAPAGITMDNQFWSNHPDWIAGISEGAASDVYLYDLRGKRTLRITDGGDCDRPDAYISPGP